MDTVGVGMMSHKRELFSIKAISFRYLERYAFEALSKSNFRAFFKSSRIWSLKNPD
jgi:hypothetical protein